jgi:hypothetical protein
MPSTDFLLNVEGESADVRSLMCHFQQDPYPSGLAYELAIRDGDVIAEGKKQFGLGRHQQPDSNKQSSFLSYLFPMIGLKCGRNEPRFWANTIDELELKADMLILKGVCSRHVSS